LWVAFFIDCVAGGNDGCTKEFGFWEYHVSDRVLKDVKATIKADLEQKAKAAEQKRRRHQSNLRRGGGRCPGALAAPIRIAVCYEHSSFFLWLGAHLDGAVARILRHRCPSTTNVQVATGRGVESAERIVGDRVGVGFVLFAGALTSAVEEEAFCLGLADSCPRCGDPLKLFKSEAEQRQHLRRCDGSDARGQAHQKAKMASAIFQCYFISLQLLSSVRFRFAFVFGKCLTCLIASAAMERQQFLCSKVRVFLICF
jgi:hypothetical protein